MIHVHVCVWGVRLTSVRTQVATSLTPGCNIPATSRLTLFLAFMDEYQPVLCTYGVIQK